MRLVNRESKKDRRSKLTLSLAANSRGSRGSGLPRLCVASPEPASQLWLSLQFCASFVLLSGRFFRGKPEGYKELWKLDQLSQDAGRDGKGLEVGTCQSTLRRWRTLPSRRSSRRRASDVSVRGP